LSVEAESEDQNEIDWSQRTNLLQKIECIILNVIHLMTSWYVLYLQTILFGNAYFLKMNNYSFNISIQIMPKNALFEYNHIQLIQYNILTIKLLLTILKLKRNICFFLDRKDFILLVK
jgi:hypothetical protein